MKLRMFAIAGALMILGSGCILPVVSPGLKADVGAAGVSSEGEVRPGLNASVGFSAASVFHPELGPPVDFGAGYLVTSVPSRGSLVQGAYLDAAWLRRLGSGWRLSLGGRAELLTAHALGTEPLGRGAALRVALETTRFSQGRLDAEGGCREELKPAHRDPRRLPGEPPSTEYDCPPSSILAGQYQGNVGLGLSAEYGVRQLPREGTSQFGMLGLTVRLPSAAMLVFGLPD